MQLTVLAFNKGVITECRYKRMLLAWNIQQSGLKEKDAIIKFSVSKRTYWRLKKLKVV
jgi:hypothetical protein